MTTADLDTFKRAVTAGTRLRCVENTYARSHGFDRSGQVLTITRAGSTTCNGTMDGNGYHLSWPKRLRDVVALDGSRITYRVGRDDHTVTWEILPLETIA